MPGTRQDDDDAMAARMDAARPDDPLADALGAARSLGALGLGDGRLTLGAYVVEERIGAGGFGTVYRGRQPSIGGRLVAIKLLDPRVVARGGGLERLRREASAAGGMEHPNIVSIHDVGESEFGPFMVMDYVSGETLAQWVTERPPFDQALAAYLQVAAALAFAHSRGVVHLDIKPANLLRSDDGRVRVLDFGIAGGPGITHESAGTANADGSAASQAPAPAESLPTDPGSSHGDGNLPRTLALGFTAGYAAPEQAVGLHVDPRTDQFSFCVSLWQALTGTLPYTSAEITRMGILGDEPIQPRGKFRGRRSIAAALRRGLSARPEDRWPQMQDLIDALSRPPLFRRPATWGLLGAVTIGLVLTLRLTSGHADVCADPRAQLAGIWDGPRRAAVSDTITQLSSHGAAAAAEVDHELDRRVEAWIDRSRSGCASAVASGSIGTAPHLEQSTCLMRYRGRIEVLTRLLVEGDGTTIAGVTDMLAELGEPDQCDEQVPREVPSVVSPELAPLLADIDAARIVLAAGRYREVEAASEALLRRANVIGSAEATAPALLLRGMAVSMVGQHAEARDALLESVARALESNDDFLAAQGWRRLTWLGADHLDDIERATEWNRMAMAVIDQLGRPPELLAEQLQALGRVQMRAGDARAAAQAYARALELLEPRLPSDDLRRVRTLGGLAHARAELGDFDEATTLYDRALGSIQGTLHAEHPLAAELLISKALLELDRGLPYLAHASAQDAERIMRACCGENAAQMSPVLAARAEIALARDELDQAEFLAESASALQNRHLPIGHGDRSKPLGVLVNAALERGDPERALAVNLRIAAELAANDPENERAIIENNIGWYLCSLGRCAEARTHHERALVDPEAEPWTRIAAASGLGAVELAADDPARALARFEPAMREALEMETSRPGLLAELQMNLAQALVITGTDRARARMLFDKARAYYAKEGDHVMLARIKNFTRRNARSATRQK